MEHSFKKKLILSIITFSFMFLYTNIMYTKITGAYEEFSPTQILPTSHIDIFSKVIPEKEVKVAFFGDQGVAASSKEVLQLVKKEEAELIVNLGDFDYEDNPDKWYKNLTDNLGIDFPIIAAAGNHDMKLWATYKQKIEGHIKNIPNLACEGTVGTKWRCNYKGIIFVMVAPGLTETKTDHANYIKDTLSKSKNLWNICAWHMDQKKMQLGEKDDQVGWGVYEKCREGGAIVATAHEHSYQRTVLMRDFKNQKIASTSTSSIQISKGKTFAFVSGLGGESIRPQKQPTDPWWASIYTADQKANYGALFCTFNVHDKPRQADCYFKNIDGKVVDTFSITSKRDVVQ